MSARIAALAISRGEQERHAQRGQPVGDRRLIRFAIELECRARQHSRRHRIPPPRSARASSTERGGTEDRGTRLDQFVLDQHRHDRLVLDNKDALLRSMVSWPGRFPPGMRQLSRRLWLLRSRTRATVRLRACKLRPLYSAEHLPSVRLSNVPQAGQGAWSDGSPDRAEQPREFVPDDVVALAGGRPRDPAESPMAILPRT